MTASNHNARRATWGFIVAVIVVAACVRVFALVSFSHSLYGDFLVLDEQVYHNWAMKLISDDPGAFRIPDFAPLPAYAMAAVYRVFSPNILYVRIMNMVFGIGTCLLVFFMGRRLAGPAVGAVSGLVAALYGPFIFFSVVLHKTSLSLFLFAALVHVCMVWSDRLFTPGGPLGKGALLIGIPAGALMGLLVNVRSNSVALAPVIVLWMAWACVRRRVRFSVVGGAVVCFIVGFVAAVSPFAIRNYRMTGDVAVTPTGGFNLYMANNPDNPLPYYRPVRFALSSPSEQAIGFTIEASRREGRRLTPKEASDFWAREVAEYAAGHPMAFIRKMGLKLLAVFNRYESADNHHLGFLKDHIGFLRFPFFSLWLVLPLGMAGLSLLFFKSEKTVLAGLLFAVYMLTMVVFFSNVRIRLPVVLILIPFGVMGLGRVAEAVKTRKMSLVFSYGMLAVFFFLLAFVPIPGRADTTAYLNIHASNLASKGRGEEALRIWEKSADMQQPYSAYANLSLADRCLERGDTDGALSRLARIPDDSLAAAIKYDRLGDVMLKLGRTREAVGAFRRSLDINSGQPLVRLKLIRIYEKTDVALAKREKAALDYVFSFYGIEP